MNHFSREIEQDFLSSTALFDLIQDPVFLMEDDHDSFRYTYANPSALALLSNREIIGSSIKDVLLPEQSWNLIHYYKKAQSSQSSLAFIETVQRPDGEFIGETTLHPVVTEDGQCRSILAIVKDVTEREHKQRSLQKTDKDLEIEQRYKSLFDNHPHGIFTFDRTGSLESINTGAENIIGYSFEELKAASFLSIFLSSETEKVWHHFYKTVHEQQPERYELAFRHKNGQLIDLQAMNIPIIVDGELLGIYGIVTDVTEVNRAQKTLVETNEKLEIFWENSIDPIFYIDTHGDILKVNPAFEKTFEFTEQEMLTGKGTIIPPNMRTDQFQIVERILNGETVNSHDTLRKTKSGKLLNIISSYSPVRNMDKEIVGSTIIYKNVTELKKAEQELQKSQEKYKLITESTLDIITMIDLSGSIEYVSPAHEKILGYSGQAYIGSPFTENVHPDDAAELREGVDSLMNGGEPTTIEARFLHRDGHYIWMEVSPTPVLINGEVVQLFTITRDITERRKLQHEIEKMAFYDHLSGIPNRRTFDDELTKAIHQADASGNKVAVLMLDGRKFKQINDQFGHDAGDAVIKEMAERLQSCIRPIDTVARLGGDEMGIVFPELDSIEIAENTAKRILKSFESPLVYNGAEITIGAGIGLSIYPDNAHTEKQLLKCADMALYEAKKLNRDDYKVFGYCK